jgi:hypothetical protein
MSTTNDRPLSNVAVDATGASLVRRFEASSHNMALSTVLSKREAEQFVITV